MIPRWLLGCLMILLLVGLATDAKAQPYGGPGAVAYGQNWGIPYPQAVPGPYNYSGPYGYYGYGGYGYVPQPWELIPPASRYLSPGFSYNPNPYAQVPNTLSYEIPPNIYAPNTYTYDLRAYGYGSGYGYSPPLYTYPAYPVYPTYPVAPYYYLYTGRPFRWGPYIAMPLRQYLAKELHGPTRVRDIVPGIPELGG